MPPRKGGHPAPIARVAEQAAPLKKQNPTDFNAPEAVNVIIPTDTAQLTVSPPDLLATADISSPSVQEAAAAEDLTKSNAYAVKRIGDFSRQEIIAKSLKIKQIARQKAYKLEALVHTPDQLQAALDDYDLTCFNLGLYPLQNLLAVWLNTTNAQLQALTSAANVSEAGQILACHTDYCVSVISSAAMQSEKPPLFSIYYLKTVYKMFDQEKQQNAPSLSVFSGNVTNINISAADITRNSQIFTEIDGGSNSSGDR